MILLKAVTKAGRTVVRLWKVWKIDRNCRDAFPSKGDHCFIEIHVLVSTNTLQFGDFVLNVWHGFSILLLFDLTSKVIMGNEISTLEGCQWEEPINSGIWVIRHGKLSDGTEITKFNGLKNDSLHRDELTRLTKVHRTFSELLKSCCVKHFGSYSSPNYLQHTWAITFLHTKTLSKTYTLFYEIFFMSFPKLLDKLINIKSCL